MAGGKQDVLDRAQRALPEEPQWAAELSDYVLALEPGHERATSIKLRALRELGELQLNATAKNYYLKVAQSEQIIVC